jgi:lipopolysaccharide export system ATP-binding protein
MAAERPELTVTDGSAGLQIRSLRKSYKKRPVILDVSMDLRRGEVVALLGPNGSGKTTCFYTIAGLVMPEGGQVLIDGKDVTALPMYRRARLGIGYLPQEVSIFRGLSVEDNILAVLEIVQPDRHKRRERLEELLSEFSITHLRRTPALALSGGERRRVEIARCLAADPKYLLLDEPFAGVDPIAVGEIRHLVHDLKSRGIGVLITDHNVRETLEIVDRAYILHAGRVLMSGTMKPCAGSTWARTSGSSERRLVRVAPILLTSSHGVAPNTRNACVTYPCSRSESCRNHFRQHWHAATFLSPESRTTRRPGFPRPPRRPTKRRDHAIPDQWKTDRRR